jgi:superfamily II DNA helicase RecQ
MIKSARRKTITICRAINVYRGMSFSNEKNHNFKKLISYGKGSLLSKSDVERIVRFMIIEDILEEEYVRNRQGFNISYLMVG